MDSTYTRTSTGSVDQPAADRYLVLSDVDDPNDVLAAFDRLGGNLPTITVRNVADLIAEEDVRELLEEILPDADVIILRLRGDRSGLRPGFEAVADHVRSTGKTLVALPVGEQNSPRTHDVTPLRPEHAKIWIGELSSEDPISRVRLPTRPTRARLRPERNASLELATLE